MSNRWQLQQAKARFSEVVNLALSDGPQMITRHGKDAVLVVRADTFQKSVSSEVPLGDFLLNSPLRGSGLRLYRLKDPPRPAPDFR